MVKVYRKPVFIGAVSGLPEKVAAWFLGRGITESVLRRNMVGHGTAYFPQVEEERTCVLFPYRRKGEVLNIKYRTGDKLFRMEGGCERVLYGLDDIGERLVWVEGEMDKLSVEVAGITSCVSVPDGAPAPDSKSYESKFDYLSAPEINRASVHIIAVDNDAPGLRLRDELVRRLGPEKCRIVDWPDGCKDANDVLVTYGADTLAQCIDNARELPIVGAFSVDDYADDIQRLYRDGVDRGVAWTGVYIFFTDKAPGITASRHHTDADGRVAVYGADIQLSALSRFLATLKIGSTLSSMTAAAAFPSRSNRMRAAPDAAKCGVQYLAASL